MSDADQPKSLQEQIDAFLEYVESGQHMFSALEWEPVDGVEGEFIMDLPFDARHAGPRGHLQGGITATLADHAAARLAMADLEPNQLVVTTDLTVHYLAGIGSGVARAVATTLRSGRATRVVRVDVFDGVDGPLAAACTVAFRVISAG